MKKKFVYFIWMWLFISACSNDRNKALNTADNSFVQDTIRINNILQKIAIHRFDNNDTALKYLTLAESLSIKNDYQAGYANSLFLRGNYLYEKNEYSGALNYYSKALDLAEKTDSVLLRAKCLERMASVHLTTGDANLALKLYYESLPLFEKVKDKRGIAKVYNIIGIYKTDTHVYDTAEYYLKKAIELNSQIGDKYAIIENKGNLGSLYEHTGNVDKAEKLYLDLTLELQAMKDKLSLPVIYYNLFSLYQNRNELPEALQFLDKGIAISEETHDTAMLADMYSDAGEVLFDRGNNNAARLELLKSIQCSRAINEARTQIHVLMLLANIDSASGDYRAAFSDIRRIPVLKDTVYQKKLKNNLKSSELQYENDKKRNLIEVQQLTIQSDKKERFLYIVLLSVALLTAILLVLVLILLRRNLSKSKRLGNKMLLLNQMEIEKHQKDLEIKKLIIENNEKEKRLKENQLLNLSLSIKQKTELLEDISNKLKVKSFEDSISVPTIQQIISQISNHKLGFNESNLFNEKFSALHPDFFQILKENHPALTKTELNFCAFLKINLSSKQIATMLNVGPEAIRKTRYRIRKKLQLNKDQSLEDYIGRY